jgi:hypothetical protein
MKLSHQRVQAKIVSERPDGRGGIVRIPVARVSNVDLSKTAGEGSGSMTVSPEIFEDITSNFAKKPGPVGLYRTHKKNRKGDEPMLGAVLDAWKDGDLLWNEIDVNGSAWKSLVENREMVGASLEAELDPEFPTATLSGWAQTGVIVTNNPALDVQFYFESADRKRFTGYPVMFSFGDDPGVEPEMSKTVTLESLEAEKLALEGKVTQMEKDAKASKDKLEAIALENAELKKRPTPEMLLSLEQKVKSIESAQLASDVKIVIASAIAAGKPPAFFEGADADPVKFLSERFGGNLAALKASAEKLPAVVKMASSGPGSGSGSGATGSAKDRVLAETQKLQAEGKAKTFNEALELVKKSHPALYAEMAEGYRPVAASE